MKLKILGSGSINSIYASASYLINQHLLLDCPNGIIKQMKRLNCNITAIDYVYISHFHADHYFDLPFLLIEHGLWQKRSQPLTIIAQRGIQQKLEQLLELAYPELKDYLITNCLLEYKIIDEKSRLSINGLEFNFYKMAHADTSVYGLTISEAEKKIGFTFDTSYCPNILTMAKDCQLLFAEMTNKESSAYHMGLDSIRKIAELYPQLRIITCHMNDETRPLAQEHFEIAEDNKMIEV